MNQAITAKEDEIEQLLQQCAGFKAQAVACDGKAEELSDEDGDIDILAQEISSQRTKAVIFRKRESSTLMLIETAKAELLALTVKKAEAVSDGLKAIAKDAEKELNKELVLLLPKLRRAQVAFAFKESYFTDNLFWEIVSGFKNLGIHVLAPLTDDPRNERLALSEEVTASV